MAATVLVAACRQGAIPRDPVIAGSISTLAVAGTSSTSPSIGVVGNRIVVVWIATTGDESSVYAAVSQDDGGTFGPPVQVNDVTGDVRVGGDQGPRVAGSADDISVVWASKLGGTSRIRMARSIDGGRSFAAATTVSGDGLTGARGWASIAGDGAGTLHTAWLDGRDAQSGMEGMPMTDMGTHAMRQDLYQAVWRAGGAVTETRVATGVCFCCKTAVAVAPNGTTYVAWRHVYPTNLRDMAVARSVDDGRTFSAPVRVSEDHWQVAGCPEDGPAIAADRRSILHVLWATMDPATGKKGVFHTTSSDGGRTFVPRTQLATGAAHPQLASLDGGVAAVWDEETPGGQQIKLAILDSPSRLSFGAADRTSPSWALGGGEAGTRPAVAATQRAIVVVWTTQVGTNMAIRVQRIAR